MYLISSSIIYLLLKIKILFPLICKFLKGRKSILYLLDLLKLLKLLSICFQVTVYPFRPEASTAHRNP